MRTSMRPTRGLWTLALVVGCSTPTSAPSPPDPVPAPTVTTPISGSAVDSPLTISGRARPDDRISLVLTQNGATWVQASALTEQDGTWSATIRFAAGTGSVVLEATAVVDGQRSTPIRVDLVSDGGDGSFNPLSITVPVDQAPVYGSVTIRGRATANAAVSAVAETTEGLVGGAATVAGDSGAFEMQLEYDDRVDPGDLITLELVQTIDGRDSVPITVGVVHGSTTRLAGTVSDPQAHMGGDVYVRAYHADADGLLFVAEQRIATASNAAFQDLDFSLDVPAGEYLIRAFRDAGGADGFGPDGEPTLGSDAQSTAASVTVTETSAPAVELTIEPPAAVALVPFFNVYSRHESSQRYTPTGPNQTPGQGECGGFYMRIEVHPNGGSGGSLGTPRVRLPNGAIVTLLDDGGCGERANNTASSYDLQPDDEQFSYGIPDPGSDLAGKYVYARVHDGSGQLGVMTDTIDEVQRLSRRVVLQAPTGAQRVTTLRPTFRWNEVPDAAGYRIAIFGPQSYNAPFVADDTWTLDTDLVDGVSFEVRLDAADANPDRGEDVDAEALGIRNRFVVDTTGTHSVEVSGTIDNAVTELEAPIQVVAGSDFFADSTLWLPYDATAFSIVALRANQAQTGYVEAFVDTDGSGDIDGPNRGYRATVQDLDLTAATTTPVSLRFVEPIETRTPAPGAVLTETQPNFTWETYDDAPSEPWSWVLYVQPSDSVGDGPPPNLYGLPSTVTSYTLGQLRDVRDIGLLARCVGGDPTDFDFMSWTCQQAVAPSVSTLASGTWRWGLVIVPCGFESATYGDCMLTQLQGSPTVSSAEVLFDVR